jgi:hypothetical protein
MEERKSKMKFHPDIVENPEHLEYNFSWQRKKKGREQSPLPLIQEVL